MPLWSDPKLHPDAVRLRASSIPGCFEWNVSSVAVSTSTTAATSVSDETNHICSFFVGCPDDSRGMTSTTSSALSSSSSLSNNCLMMSNPFMNTTSTNTSTNTNTTTESSSEPQQQQHELYRTTAIANLARITIYCHTGTIMTSRIWHGCVRNIFRKNVTSLDIVERCLRHPPELPSIDWNLIGHWNHNKNHYCNTTSSSTQQQQSTNDDAVEMKKVIHSIPKNLELIDVGIAILTSERDKLLQHAKTLEVTKTTTTSATTTQMQKAVVGLPTTATTTGMEFQFSLSAGPMKHVDQCLHDINEMGKLVKWVATNGVGTVFLYGNGGVAYTPNIPHPLYQRLSQLRSSKLHSSRPKYVSLGTKDRFFVTFHDNTFHYSKGLKVLDRELKKLSKPPISVAFGTTYDAFCIVYDDGTYKYHGRGIPTAFTERLNASTSTTNPTAAVRPIQRLSSMALGPSGEWFVRYQDGQVDYGNVSTEMNHAIQELRRDGHTINFLDFGENSSYFVSYD